MKATEKTDQQPPPYPSSPCRDEKIEKETSQGRTNVKYNCVLSVNVINNILSRRIPNIVNVSEGNMPLEL